MSVVSIAVWYLRPSGRGAGVHGTLDEIARAEGIDASYVSRIMRLTLPAPDILVLPSP